MMDGALTIRPATPDDAPAGAYLVHLAMGRLADFLLGFNEPTRAREVLARLFAAENNRFSHRFVALIETGGKATGLLMAYPARVMNGLALPMAKQLLNIYGISGVARFLHRVRPLISIKEAETDEYFISTLAVLPEFQGRGIGARLLGHAEAQAKAGGLSKCSLTVEFENVAARRLYERPGYQIVETIPIRELERRIGYRGFYRMVKRNIHA